MNTTKQILWIAGILALAFSRGQAAFDSGSDGSDGELYFGPDMGEVIFDPDDFDPPLDADRDGIYKFINIIVGAGTRVSFRADVLGHKPLIWLASGNMIIDGELDLGEGPNQDPGVGGFYGGTMNGLVDGQGPGGGTYAFDGTDPIRDPVFAHINPYLIPLVGASGQGASDSVDGRSGGGVALIAASGTITINGNVSSGGAHERSNTTSYPSGNLRLVANEIAGLGTLYSFNVIRMEAFQHAANFDTFGEKTIIKTRPGALFPQNPIKIMLVDGSAVDHAKPGANKGEPDVTIDNGNEVMIMVECVGIPEGLTVRVVGWNDSVGQVEAMTTPLMTQNGNVTQATCTMVIPTGNTTFMAQVVTGP